mmetsp:Transcript_15903/g.44427  ORF Transcript_15903/g.44427 Transcript_15903/m.44427 type:complete len:276 (+) Transcript_15903:287-1114(+)
MASTRNVGAFLVLLSWIQPAHSVTEARLRVVRGSSKITRAVIGRQGEGTDGLSNPGIDGPCSKVECPEIEDQVMLTKLGSVARRYPVAEWVTSENDVMKFSDSNSDQFRDSFLKIIKFRKEANYLEEPIPITTPLVVSLKLNTRQQARGQLSFARAKGFKYGYTLYYRLHSSAQGDPSREPTDQQILISPWSPTVRPTDWVAVLQWQSDVAEDLHPDNTLFRYIDFTGRINKVLQKHNRALSNAESMFYVMYGSPVDRVHEIWVPLSQSEVDLLK